ncbi:hypothetical protein KKH23_00495 [Patescibacteria group bacterium]|nr:hypothetical protein [Patescibacteria group bacterium]MBU0776954.1 hypothetical protein [Patescibacteria group bacterium]MBU0845672.1 hypothetical protein [Patescibacteria group bacterium]MBU0922983.1 hypothetical protein [Patescibacteria group bacterium]MBU1066916.1 hypothetical protein [Patescibacteria group bacterium]
MTKIKKFLPLILLLLGIVVIVGAYFFVTRSKKEGDITEDETSLIEVPLSDRPITSLTPSNDGHWLTLVIEKITIDAASLDYELLYKLPDGRTQGVPGSINLDGENEIERELLLGSESSGKFRYDEGVEKGTLTLRFRNEKGKLIAKFSTEFALLSGISELASVDEDFTVSLNKKSSEYFVVMETFGVPEVPGGEVVSGPYGVFSSATTLSGTVKIGSGTLHRWSGSEWSSVSGETSGIGIFIGLSE